MSTLSRRGRRLRRLGWQASVLAVAVTLALVLAQHTAGAAFTAQTGNGGDTVSSAASFCASPGTSSSVNPSADTSTYQSNPTTTYGTATIVGTISASGANARAFLLFPLPTPPAYCSVASATLKLYATTVTAGRQIDVSLVDPTPAQWTESGLTWSTQPGSAATPAAVGSASLSAVNAWQSWTVTGLVKALYAGTNHGFLFQDHAENAGSMSPNYYTSREGGANQPVLTITWG